MNHVASFATEGGELLQYVAWLWERKGRRKYCRLPVAMLAPTTHWNESILLPEAEADYSRKEIGRVIS